jgi:hypothetical protein
VLIDREACGRRGAGRGAGRGGGGGGLRYRAVVNHLREAVESYRLRVAGLRKSLSAAGDVLLLRDDQVAALQRQVDAQRAAIAASQVPTYGTTLVLAACVLACLLTAPDLRLARRAAVALLLLLLLLL